MSSYKWLMGICALLAGMAPAIYKALDFDVNLNSIAQHAQGSKALEDRFRQAWTRRTGDLRPQVSCRDRLPSNSFGLHMQKTKVQALCTAITNETDPNRLVALIKELRKLLAEQQANLEATISSQHER